MKMTIKSTFYIVIMQYFKSICNSKWQNNFWKNDIGPQWAVLWDSLHPFGTTSLLSFWQQISVDETMKRRFFSAKKTMKTTSIWPTKASIQRSDLLHGTLVFDLNLKMDKQWGSSAFFLGGGYRDNSFIRFSQIIRGNPWNPQSTGPQNLVFSMVSKRNIYSSTQTLLQRSFSFHTWRSIFEAKATVFFVASEPCVETSLEC